MTLQLTRLLQCLAMAQSTVLAFNTDNMAAIVVLQSTDKKLPGTGGGHPCVTYVHVHKCLSRPCVCVQNYSHLQTINSCRH